MARGRRPHKPRTWQDGTSYPPSFPLSTGSNIQQFPINLRTYELSTPRKPKAHYYEKQPKQYNRGIIHIARRDRQLGWEADERSNHRDEQRRKEVADVAHGAEIEGSRGKGGLAASGEDYALGDGVGDVLDWRVTDVS